MRREWELALVAALAATTTGCMGQSILPAWSSGKSSTASATSLDQLSSKKPASSESSLKKATSGMAEALTIHPKVTPATDATSLTDKPQKLGPEVYISAARLHEGRGNTEAAVQQYQKALEVAPQHPAALIGLARLHDRQRQFVQAEGLYRQAAQVEPRNPLIWNDLGLCYARQKRLPEAVRMLQYATSLAPENAMYRNNIASVLVEQGQIDEALGHLASVNPPAVAHYNLGYLLHQRQQTQWAAHHLQLALQADPSLAPAEQLLMQISGPIARRPQPTIAVSMPLEEGPAEAPMPAVPRYTLTDEGDGGYPFVTNPPGEELTNPLAPSTRRAAIYRMPPVDEQADDPAPAPTRLPQVEQPAVEYPTEQLELGNPRASAFPVRQMSAEEDELRQPQVIRLLGEAPAAAPVPE